MANIILSRDDAHKLLKGESVGDMFKVTEQKLSLSRYSILVIDGGCSDSYTEDLLGASVVTPGWGEGSPKFVNESDEVTFYPISKEIVYQYVFTDEDGL